MVSKRKQWFLDRIGKRVYRNNTYCCEHCQKIYHEGLIIQDNFHAIYVYDCESEISAEGGYIRYFDTREEALQFERQHRIGILKERIRSKYGKFRIKYRTLIIKIKNKIKEGIKYYGKSKQ